MTDAIKQILVEGQEINFCNQHSVHWTHPYAWEGRGTLHTSGCGIFALCHAAQWLTGKAQDPCQWADFSCRHGGRGDDGTDRPALLSALQETGEASRLGFRYAFDGLRNDLDTLQTFLLEKRGVSLCNLRRGHIVCLVDARVLDGQVQLLAIDSASESASERVREHVCEVLPGTEITRDVQNQSGLPVGETMGYAAYWVQGNTPMDFNLLHRI